MFLPACVFPSGLGNIPVAKIGGSPFPHRGAIFAVGGCPGSSVVCDPTACDEAGIAGICSSTGTNVRTAMHVPGWTVVQLQIFLLLLCKI